MHTSPPHSLHFIFFCILFTYFLPTVVAVLRRHSHAVGVFFVNLLFGWTGIGWLVAQIWSFTNDPATRPDTGKPLCVKILCAAGIVYYILLFGFIAITGHKPSAVSSPHATAAQSSSQTAPVPQMTPIPQNGVPAPASDLIGQ